MSEHAPIQLLQRLAEGHASELPEMAQALGGDAMLVFACAGHPLCINASAVLRLIAPPPFVSVPGAGAAISGLSNIGGEPAVVACLSALVDLEDDGGEKMALLMEAGPGDLRALLVSADVKLRRLRKSEGRAPDSPFAMIAGVARASGEERYTELDVPRLLASPTWLAQPGSA